MGRRNGHDGVAVTLAAVDVVHRRGAAAAALADDDHVGLQFAAGPQQHHARGDIRTAAGAGMGDDLDRLRGIFLLADRRAAGQRDADHRRRAKQCGRAHGPAEPV